MVYPTKTCGKEKPFNYGGVLAAVLEGETYTNARYIGVSFEFQILTKLQMAFLVGDVGEIYNGYVFIR